MNNEANPLAVGLGFQTGKFMTPPTMSPVHHVLKCWPISFWAIGERRKLFEVRINDRDFQEGDSAELREWDPHTEAYTHRWIFCKVGWVLREPFLFAGLKPGFCAWSIILPNNHTWPPTDPSQV